MNKEQEKITIDKDKLIARSEIAVFWDNFSKVLPESRARSEIGDEKIFIAFKDTFIKVREFYKENYISKEEVRERIEDIIDKDNTEISDLSIQNRLHLFLKEYE